MTFPSRSRLSIRRFCDRSGTVRLLGLLVGLLFFVGGCSSTKQIETSRPQTIDPADRGDQPAVRQARLTVALEQGDTSLPEDIERFEFRIAEVRLHRTDGEWIRLPSDVHQFALPLHRSARRAVLDTRVAPAAYDSVALSFDHLFARFSENAGGPLTTADGEPLRLALEITTSLDVASAITLRFEPGASLRRAPDCRWFFVPVVQASVE